MKYETISTSWQIELTVYWSSHTSTWGLNLEMPHGLALLHFSLEIPFKRPEVVRFPLENMVAKRRRTSQRDWTHPLHALRLCQFPWGIHSHPDCSNLWKIRSRNFPLLSILCLYVQMRSQEDLNQKVIGSWMDFFGLWTCTSGSWTHFYYKSYFSGRRKTLILHACEVHSSVSVGQKAERASKWIWKGKGKRTLIFTSWPC